MLHDSMPWGRFLVLFCIAGRFFINFCKPGTRGLAEEGRMC